MRRDIEIGTLCDNGEIIRGQTDQGIVYKNYNNYVTGEGVCYVPELSDTLYTRADILSMCNNNERVANFIFDVIDWQSPEAFLNDLLNSADEFPEFFEENENGEYIVKEE